MAVEVPEEAEPLTVAVAGSVDGLAEGLADVLGESVAEVSVLVPVGEEDESTLAVGVAVLVAVGVPEFVAVVVVVAVAVGVVGVVVGVEDDVVVVGEADVPLGAAGVEGAAGVVDEPEDGLVVAADAVLGADAGVLGVVVTADGGVRVALPGTCRGRICDRLLLSSGVVTPRFSVGRDVGVIAPLLAACGMDVDPIVPAAVGSALSCTDEIEVVGFTGEELAVASFVRCEPAVPRETAAAAAAIPITPTELSRMPFAGADLAVSRPLVVRP